MEQEREIGVWRRSMMTWGFWWRTIVTLGLYVVLLWRRNQITVTTRRVSQRRGNILGGEETTISLGEHHRCHLRYPTIGGDLWLWQHHNPIGRVDPGGDFIRGV